MVLMFIGFIPALVIDIVGILSTLYLTRMLFSKKKKIGLGSRTASYIYSVTCVALLCFASSVYQYFTSMNPMTVGFRNK